MPSSPGYILGCDEMITSEYHHSHTQHTVVLWNNKLYMYLWWSTKHDGVEYFLRLWCQEWCQNMWIIMQYDINSKYASSLWDPRDRIASSKLDIYRLRLIAKVMAFPPVLNDKFLVITRPSIPIINTSVTGTGMFRTHSSRWSPGSLRHQAINSHDINCEQYGYSCLL